MSDLNAFRQIRFWQPLLYLGVVHSMGGVRDIAKPTTIRRTACFELTVTPLATVDRKMVLRQKCPAIVRHKLKRRKDKQNLFFGHGVVQTHSNETWPNNFLFS